MLDLRGKFRRRIHVSARHIVGKPMLCFGEYEVCMPDEIAARDLLQFAVRILGRAVMPPETVREIIGPGKKQIKAFNLCDGNHTLTQIAQKTRINSGNLSRTLDRWETLGVIFRIGESRSTRPLHVYPIPENDVRRRDGGNRADRE